MPTTVVLAVRVPVVPKRAAVVPSPTDSVVEFTPAIETVIRARTDRIIEFAGKLMVVSVVAPLVESATLSLNVAKTAVSPFPPVRV
jgi:hypothetical protein